MWHWVAVGWQLMALCAPPCKALEITQRAEKSKKITWTQMGPLIQHSNISRSNFFSWFFFKVGHKSVVRSDTEFHFAFVFQSVRRKCGHLRVRGGGLQCFLNWNDEAKQIRTYEVFQFNFKLYFLGEKYFDHRSSPTFACNPQYHLQRAWCAHKLCSHQTAALLCLQRAAPQSLLQQ